MGLSPGTRLGAYEIVGLIGAGGMGEVYEGRDTRLHRTVAIKVLTPQLTSDPQFRARFDREAQILSRIDHPHVCAIHDVGEHDGVAFLVMPYLQGETLSERLGRGPLSVDEALKLGIDVVDALDHAHTAGIVHRDLKPGNIFLTRAGATLLDFGLATPTPFLTPSAMSASPTAAPLTLPGTLVGTVFYMAPEQLEARDVDARTDIFAFGAVLYEMVTGKRAFDGATPASVVASILSSDPPSVSSLRPVLSSALDRLVRKCLNKDPLNRWQTARDLADELRWIRETLTVPATIPNGGRQNHRRLVFGLAALAVVLVASIGAMLAFRRSAPAHVMRFAVVAPDSSRINTFALSPDGRHLAFSTSTDSWLYLRPLDSTEATRLADTQGARGPFWSPDGRSIGFFADGKLKAISLVDNSVRIICDARGGRTSGDWSREGVIVFGSDIGRPINKVSAAGGQPTPVTTVTSARGHIHPSFLPDGRRFLYYEQSVGIRRASIDAADDALLIPTANTSWAQATAKNQVLFVRDSQLMAQSLDADRASLLGEPVLIGNVSATNQVDSGFSVTRTGLLAVLTRPRVMTELVWVSRTGDRLGTIADDGTYGNPQLSANGSHLVVSHDRDVWVFDVTRPGAKVRITSEPTHGGVPVWSPDDRYIVYERPPGTTRGVFRRLASGTGTEEALWSTPNVNPNSYSADGRYILASFFTAEGNRDLGVLSVGDARPPWFIAQTKYNETQGQFSPDGKWVAYVSDESGQSEIYVQRFPDGEGRKPISTDGGRQPRWRRDGRELFYLSATSELMAVPVQADSAALKAGSPEVLFKTTADASSGLGTTANYDVDSEGNKFIVAFRVGGLSSAVEVTVNWPVLLSR